MSDICSNWDVTIPFHVEGNEDGSITETVLDVAIKHAPDSVVGLVASADTEEARVWLSFTVVSTSEVLARRVTNKLKQAVSTSVFADEAQVRPATHA